MNIRATQTPQRPAHSRRHDIGRAILQITRNIPRTPPIIQGHHINQLLHLKHRRPSKHSKELIMLLMAVITPLGSKASDQAAVAFGAETAAERAPVDGVPGVEFCGPEGLEGSAVGREAEEGKEVGEVEEVGPGLVEATEVGDVGVGMDAV
jgi:hypothetical protein